MFDFKILFIVCAVWKTLFSWNQSSTSKVMVILMSTMTLKTSNPDFHEEAGKKTRWPNYWNSTSLDSIWTPASSLRCWGWICFVSRFFLFSVFCFLFGHLVLIRAESNITLRTVSVHSIYQKCFCRNYPVFRHFVHYNIGCSWALLRHPFDTPFMSVPLKK